MDSFVTWLHATPLSLLFQRHAHWLWPLCETLHFMGLALIIGMAGFFDLRLLGVMKRIPIRASKAFMPWAMVGFALNLTTGMVFFISEPGQYVGNRAWWAKVCLLLVAVLNVIVFETTLSPKVLTLGPDDDTPTSVKIVGAVSLISWIGVLYCGRMLPFIDASVEGSL